MNRRPTDTNANTAARLITPGHRVRPHNSVIGTPVRVLEVDHYGAVVEVLTTDGVTQVFGEDDKVRRVVKG